MMKGIPIKQDVQNIIPIGGKHEKQENGLTPEQIRRKKRTHQIIIDNMLWAGLGGIIPLPFFDIICVTAIQLKMINELSYEYNVEFSEHIGKALITSITAGITTDFLGKRGLTALTSVLGVSQAAAELISLGFIGSTATFAIGKVFDKHFELGGTLLDFKFSDYKKLYKEKLTEAKSAK